MFNDAQNALLNPLQAIAGTFGGGQDQQDPHMQQAAFNGMGQIGALLMAAGGRMTSQERARILAGIAPVIGNIPTTALNAAQARLMQSKATQEQDELARQQAIQERLQDPAFAQSLGMTPEQASLLGVPGAIDVLKARAARDPMDAAYKAAMIKKLSEGDARQWQVVGENEFGQKQYGYPPVPGEAPAGAPTPLPGGAPAPAPQQSGSILDQIGDATGTAALEKLQKLNPTVAAEVSAIVNGNQPFPPRMMGTPHGAMLNALVSVVDPEYNAATFGNRKRTRDNFNNTTPNSAGGQRQFGNVGIKHMAEIYKNADNLPNHTNFGPLNTTINQLDIARQEKSAQGGAVNSYKLSVMNGFDEIAKALGIGDAGGRHELQSKLEAANGPEAIKAVVREQAKLLKEKLDTLQGNWNDQMGPAAGKYRVIDPEAEKALNVILGEGGETSAAPAAPAIKTIRQVR